jgi:hypothetical protein
LSDAEKERKGSPRKANVVSDDKRTSPLVQEANQPNPTLSASDWDEKVALPF